MDDLICNNTDSIYHVFRQIDKNGKGFAFIIDSINRKYKGIVTDGDLRRSILDKLPIELSVEEIIKNKNKSVVARIGDSTEKLLSYISENIKYVPILDDKDFLVDYFEYKAEFHIPIASTELTGKELSYVNDCILSNWISSQGKYVQNFESAFAGYIGSKYGVSVMNGTAALHLALLALGVGEGDEVLVPDLTFAATINSVLYTGATPVIVDINKHSWCIDVDEVLESITEKTKAILLVHIYGQPCDMSAFLEIAKKKKIYIIEDCAEAHGATYEGRKIGSFGEISCFSFYGNKIVSTGEGGMCLTDNEELFNKMRVIRDHGMDPKKKYWHSVIGYNYRMTNIQAAIGLAQLERIEELQEKRHQINQWYAQNLENVKAFQRQEDLNDRKKVVWLVSYLVSDPKISRDLVITKAKEYNIDLRPFFYPLSQMPIYSRFARKRNEVSERISAIGLNLPTILSLNYEEYKRIGEILTNIIEELGKI
ncbi:aminotransferase class I/II-fold pyridoxal phosphate-dependent enzyme [Leptospira sp. FAT2]|uniref:aminotransferase class I/II-fold pyridoxal phosphate-dependent enzyme n=1 Tax=Leptospira sanjuanensis TaxID=2879643 RepID=UPI001EE7B479|nr:aminotransferase class I/II-fold pyridoxal phosphate-dependent enzyme [Leptospira sanjuanensis]MCG6167601.1 aminotransferase class I/II-fold pyridoxal phosphate-dependent enzyme [Leptospira sanjuanensis]MCG6193020.1 aminotransferase class I/II-fold pyridoxal phosphate-dependent enzyme [Leptospira sanjuanensis]